MPRQLIEIAANGRCYRIDIEKQALFSDLDARVRLTRQQWDLLSFFIQHPPHTLLTKNQLVENVWARTASVSDDAVSLAVKSLRRALEDRQGEFIQTDHGLGYRFAGDIREADSRPSGAPEPVTKSLNLKNASALVSRSKFRSTPSVSALEFVDLQIRQHLTPILEVAIMERSHDVISALVLRGADVNTTEVSYGSLGFLLICESDEDEIGEVSETARRLIRSGYDPNLQDVHGMNVLFESVYMAFRAPLTEILLDAGAEVDHRDKEGSTPLMQAARFMESRNASILLAAGANPNLADDEGNSPLVCAIDYERWAGPFEASDFEGADLEDLIIKFAKLLFEYGADLTASAPHARDPIALAAENGFSKVVEFLRGVETG